MISNPSFIWILSLVNLAIIGMALLFTYESIREQEPRAPKWGAALTALHLARHIHFVMAGGTLADCLVPRYRCGGSGRFPDTF